jgi:hypothetical protein
MKGMVINLEWVFDLWVIYEPSIRIVYALFDKGYYLKDTDSKQVN